MPEGSLQEAPFPGPWRVSGIQTQEFQDWAGGHSVVMVGEQVDGQQGK